MKPRMLQFRVYCKPAMQLMILDRSQFESDTIVFSAVSAYNSNSSNWCINSIYDA